jgi:hypothetical protein
MKIESPCLFHKRICLLTYVIERAGWECTGCGTLFEIPEGYVRLDDGSHIDWHGESQIASQVAL